MEDAGEEKFTGKGESRHRGRVHQQKILEETYGRSCNLRVLYILSRDEVMGKCGVKYS